MTIQQLLLAKDNNKDDVYNTDIRQCMLTRFNPCSWT